MIHVHHKAQQQEQSSGLLFFFKAIIVINAAEITDYNHSSHLLSNYP
jgi:hypothetical protein